ncbi:MAG: hypothetical protein A2539_10255 [Elusimicrobia bacterium RIFOXYD2_FULL_34_15]|nr:MAG: hypothetical protein A2539_10255 [Elusimicrobia bacterium RIFOXYD2_FULL_34_15]
MKVCIDPGHGGDATGAVGPTGLLEKNENLIISDILRIYLANAGASVFRTRVDDTDVSFAGRVQKGVDNNVDWFISVHLNAGAEGDHTTNRTEVYYYFGEYLNMATLILERQFINLAIPKSGPLYGNFYVLRENPKPADLTESAFISCTVEESLLKASDIREDKMALSIYEGIVDYFTPPIAQKVSITQGGQSKYEAYWQDGTSARIWNKTSDTPINAQSNATVIIEFSKVAEIVMVDVNNVAITGSLDATKKKWTGAITQTMINDLGDGQKTLNIIAHDRAVNFLDGKPNTIAKYNFLTKQYDNYEDENGANTHEGGHDKNHSFTIDTSPPEEPELGDGTPGGNGGLGGTGGATVTKDKRQIIKGTAEPGSTVIVIVNGKEPIKVIVDDDGTFEVPIDLDEGDNEIVVYIEDKAGNKSGEKKFNITLDTIPPQIQVPEKIVIYNPCGVDQTKIATEVSFGASDANGVTEIIWDSDNKQFDPAVKEAFLSDIFYFGQHTIGATDKVNNSSSKNFEIKIEYEDCKRGPGNDTPDDNESVNTVFNESSNTGITIDTTTPIALLLAGIAGHASRLITNEYGQDIRAYSPMYFDGKKLAENYKVLIIPSGGLMGYSNSTTFKQKLQDYVNAGGTLIVFSQQHGYDFSALPTNSEIASSGTRNDTLAGFGWAEDQSCHSNSTYINEESPIFNEQSKVNLDCNVDGYFTQWPNNAKVLLNRTKNNMPCMIEYTIKGREVEGRQVEGRVIATTLYSDFSYAQGSLSSEESTLIKNLITYSKDPSTPATQSLKLAQPIEGIGYSVQSPSDVLLVGQDVVFSIKINNTTNEDRTIRVEWDWLHSNRYVMGSYPVPANTEVTIPYTMTNIQRIGNIWQFNLFFYDENNSLVGNCLIGGQAYEATCDVKVTTENKQYYPNDTVAYTINLTNKIFVNYSGDIDIKVLNNNNQMIHETTDTYDFALSTSIGRNYTFSLPSNIEEGNYIILCEVKKIGSTDKINVASTYFEIPKARIEIPSILPQVFIPNAVNNVTYNVANKEGDKTVNGSITVKMIQPDNTLMYTETKNFTIAPGVTAPIEFGIPIGNVKFGNYRLEATASYEGTTVESINVIPSNATIAVNFNKTYYGIRENLRLDVSVFAGGKFQQKDLKVVTQISALNYTDEKTITLNPTEVYVSTHMVNIPETIITGTYNTSIRLEVKGINGAVIDSVTKQFTFTVPPADLKMAGLDKDVYVTSQDSSASPQNDTTQGNMRIQNTGGVDGKWDYVLRLYNDEELPVYEKQGVTVLLNPQRDPSSVTQDDGGGQGYQEIFFDLSDQLKSGNYRFELNGINTATGKIAFDYKRFMISGLEASVSVNTSKEIYKTNENVGINASITVGPATEASAGLRDAATIVKVYSASPGWENIMHDKRVYSIAKDPDNKTIWFATDGGLISFDTTTVKWQHFTTAEGLPFNDLRCVAVDEQDVYLTGESPDLLNGYLRFAFGKFNKTTHQSEIISTTGSQQSVSIINAANLVWFLTDRNAGNYFVEKYDKLSKTWSHYIDYNSVYYDGVDTWLASNDNNVYKYDPLTDTMKVFIRFGVPLSKIAGDEQYIWGYANVYDPYSRTINIYRINKITLASELVKQNFWLGNINDNNQFQPSIMYSEGDRLYFCNQGVDRGLVWYDKVTGLSGDYSNIFDSVLSFTADKNNLWVGTYSDIYRFEKNYQWQNYTRANWLGSNNIARVASDDKYLFAYATDSGLYKYDLTNNTYKNYAWSFINSIFLLNDTTTLIGSDSGLTEFNNLTNDLRVISLPESLPVYDIKRDAGDVFLACNSKIFKYQLVNNQWQAYDVPPGSNIRKICPDGRYIWAAGYVSDTFSYLYRYDREENRWDTIMSNIWWTGIDMCVDNENVWVYFNAPYQGALRKYNKLTGVTSDVNGFFGVSTSNGKYTGCIIPDGNYLWLGGKGGVVKYNKETDEKEIFTMSEGLAGNNIVNGAVSDDSVWFAVNDLSDLTGGGGVSRFLKKGKVYYSNVIDNVSGTGVIPVSDNAGAIVNQGKYYTEVMVKNRDGQKLASGDKGFFVNDGDAVLTFNTDKRAYKPGETIDISGAVHNFGLTELTTSVVLLKGNEQILSQEYIIPANGVTSFSLTTLANEPFELKGRLGATETIEHIWVEKPIVDLVVTGPDIVGQEQFEILAFAKNIGKVNASLELNFAGEISTFTLKPSENRLFARDFNINKDTLFNIIISSEVVKTVLKYIKFDGKILFACPVLKAYPEGNISVPINIVNNGNINLSLNFIYELTKDGARVNYLQKSYSLLTGAQLGDTLVYYLTEGEYVLNYYETKSGLAKGSVLIKVAKENIAEITNLTDNKAVVTNTGCNEFYGVLKIKTDFAEILQDMVIPIGENREYSYTLPNVIVAASYTVKTEILYNQSVVSERSIYKKYAPLGAITNLSSEFEVAAGTSATLEFDVTNIGNASGNLEVSVSAGDVANFIKKEYFNIDEQKNLSFEIKPADDLDTRKLMGFVTCKNEFGDVKESTFTLKIIGYKAGVSAQLDKQYYLEGDTATFTMNIWSTNSETITDGFIKVNFNTYEASRTIANLTQSTQTFSFNVPVHHTGSKLFYGVYLASGRSLYLNSSYIYPKNDVVTVSADKQIYNTGENANINIITNSTGTLSYTVFGTTNEILVPGLVNLTLTLPQEIVTGTYYVDYRFSAQGSTEIVTGRIPIDVVGYTTRILESTLDKSEYAIGENMELILRIDSNRDIVDINLNGILKDNDGNSYITIDKTIDLLKGENIIIATGTITGGSDGLTQLVYTLNKNNLALVSGMKSFDLVVKDILPPQSQLQISDYKFQIDGKIYITPKSEISLSAVDYGEFPLGVKGIYYSIDKNTYSFYPSTSLPLYLASEDIHTIDYYSVDKRNNTELIKSATFYVDNTPPEVELKITNYKLKIDDKIYVSSVPVTVEISANDPVINGVASGLMTFSKSINNGNWTDITVPLYFDSGSNSIEVSAIDNVMNQAQNKKFTVNIDTIPPVSQLEIKNEKLKIGDKYYVNAETLITITAQDVGEAGVKKIEYAITNSEVSDYSFLQFVNYSKSLDLTQISDGEHYIYYRSVDNVDNTENIKSYNFILDKTTPETELQISNSIFQIGDKIFISSPTAFNLTATDNLSGVKRTELNIDNNSWFEYIPVKPEFPGCISYWKFDAGSGNVANDFYGVSNGVINGATWSDSGIYGKALSFDGINDSVNINDASFPSGTSPITISMWIKPFTMGGTPWGPMPFWLGSTSMGNIYCHLQPDGSIVAGGWAEPQAYSAPGIIKANNWYLFTVTSDGSGIKVYVDGNMVVSRNQRPINKQIFMVGGAPFGYYFNGLIDDVMVFNRALTGQEISQRAIRVINSIDKSCTISYRSIDNVNNIELAKTKDIIIDNFAPEISISTSIAGRKYVATIDKINIDYTITDLTPSATTGYLTLVECSDTSKIGSKYNVKSGDQIEPLSLPYYGFYTMSVEATDSLGNYSSSTTGKFEVVWDTKPPKSQYTVYGTQYTVDGKTYITAESQIELTAVDDLIAVGDGIGLGIQNIKYKVVIASETQQSDFVNYIGTFTITTEGEYVISYYSIDVIGNIEQIKTLDFIVDNIPPTSVHSIQDSVYQTEDKIFVSSETIISLISIDPSTPDGRSGQACGLKYTEYKIDSGPYTIALSHDCTIPLDTLAEGEHTIYYRSYDNLLNQEQEKSLTITIDNSVPETWFVVHGSQFIDNDNRYITSESLVELLAVDSNTIPSGIKETKYTIYTSTDNIPAYIQYTTTFNITGIDGIYSMNYYSQDNIENTEPERTITIKLDNTPPESELQISDYKFQIEDKTYISSDTEIIIIAEDPIINGASSGLKDIKFKIDGSEFVNYTSSFTLTEGVHTIKYYAEDNVGILETIKEQTYYVDTTPPVTTISTTETYITPDTPISFIATDPSTSSGQVPVVASGINKTEYSIDNGNFNIYITSFTLSVGTHTVTYRSIDNVSNTETLKSTVFTVTQLTEYAAFGIEGIIINGQSKIYGDVRSNKQIKLSGQALIDGNAEGQKITLTGQSKIIGTITQNAQPINPYTIDLDTMQVKISQNNDNDKIPLTGKGKKALINGILTLSGQDTITISTGTYYLSGIDLSGQAKLNLTGEIQIFSIGKIQIAGQSEVHSTGNPYKLIIYCNTTQPIQISGQGELKGIIYAPYSDVSINGQGITLSNVIAKSIDINGQSKIVGVNYKEKPILLGAIKQAPSAEFVKGEVYAYPNPAKNGYQPIIHVECGIADLVEIRIYNVAGELVHKDEISTQPMIKNNKYAYEYTWDISNKASGVYLYLVRAHKNSEKTIKVLKKIALIK